MEKILEKLSKYREIHAEILDAFGASGWYQIEDQTDCRWCREDALGDISWLDESGTEYGYDYANQIGDPVDNLRLYFVQDNGEKFYAMFSDTMRLKDYEEFEDQVDVSIKKEDAPNEEDVSE